jgi:DNA-binding LytR/AlgR family response regulator
MNVQVKQIDEKENECVVIECVEVTREVDQIRAFVLTTGAILTGYVDNHIIQLKLSDVYCFEAVDEKVFAYTKDDSFELKVRLYELENAYEDRHFIRCSKSFIINLMLLDSISPALNGRFTAHMSNNEKIMITRQYVPKLKAAIMGGKVDGY